MLRTKSSSLLSNKLNNSSNIYEEVKEIDFAEFLKSLNSQIEILKIDIEGYEIDLINYLLDEGLINNINKIYVETHENKFENFTLPTEKLKMRIKDEGYEKKFFYDWD